MTAVLDFPRKPKPAAPHAHTGRMEIDDDVPDRIRVYLSPAEVELLAGAIEGAARELGARQGCSTADFHAALSDAAELRCLLSVREAFQ